MKGRIEGRIVRINRNGLCEIRVNDPMGDRRSGFRLNKLAGYRGQSMKEFGIRVGAGVEIEEDNEGRVKSARLLKGRAYAHS